MTARCKLRAPQDAAFLAMPWEVRLTLLRRMAARNERLSGYPVRQIFQRESTYHLSDLPGEPITTETLRKRDMIRIWPQGIR